MVASRLPARKTGARPGFTSRGSQQVRIAIHKDDEFSPKYSQSRKSVNKNYLCRFPRHLTGVSLHRSVLPGLFGEPILVHPRSGAQKRTVAPGIAFVTIGLKVVFLTPIQKVCLSMFSGTETRPVEVVVDLPLELADDVQAVNDTDPDFLCRVIQYALARRIIFEELASPQFDRR